MNPSTSKILLKLVEVSLWAIFLFFLFSVLQSVLFYNSWDMDFITSLDLIQMQSGELPIHINHTGVGMYVFLHLMLAVFKFFNALSVTNLEQFLGSYNLILVNAEFTQWVKDMNLLVITGIVFFNVQGTKNLLKGSLEKFSLLALLTLMTMGSLWKFHVLLTRSELYALLYFSMGFWLYSYFSLLEKISFSQIGFLGFVLGLGFITKFQGLFLLLTFFTMLWPFLPKIQVPSWVFHRGLHWGALGLFFLVSLLSRLTYQPSYFADFADSFRPNVLFIIAVALLSVPMVFNRPKILAKVFFVNTQTVVFSHVLWWTFVAGLCSFAVHFIFFKDITSSFEYLLYSWRMVFIKVSKHNSIMVVLSDFWKISSWNLQYFWPSLVALSFLFGWNLKQKRNFFWFALLFLMANLIIGNRGHIQDAIWNELLIFWICLFLLKEIKDWRLVFTALALLLFTNLKNIDLRKFLKRNASGFQSQTAFLKEPYESPQIPYTEKIREEMLPYPLYVEKSLHYAVFHKEIKRLLLNTWVFPKVDLKTINILTQGAKVRGQEIKDIPSDFLNGILSTPPKEVKKLSFNFHGRYEQWIGFEDWSGVDSSCVSPDIVFLGLSEKKISFKKIVPGNADPNITDITSCTFMINKKRNVYLVQNMF